MKEPITPEERQAILEQAPKLVKYGIDKGWIKPPQQEKPHWSKNTNRNPLSNALS